MFYARIPDDDFAEFAVVFLSGSNILANLRTEAEVRDALLLTIDATESCHVL
jgi:hypothetical protein